MGFLMEDLEPVLKAASFSNLKRKPPILMAGEDNRSAAPNEAIMLFDEDIDTEEGSDCYGYIIFEKQPGSIVAWTTNREDREKMRDDIVAAINGSGLNIMIIGINPLPVFTNYFGLDIRIRRCH